MRLIGVRVRWRRGAGRFASGLRSVSTCPRRRPGTWSRPRIVLRSSLTLPMRLGRVRSGFDRAVAVGRFASRDDNLDVLDDLAGFDVVGIRTLAAKRRRMTRVDEECAFRDRYLTVQPNIDESAWSLNSRLPGVAGHHVVQAVEAKADTLPDNPMGTASRAARNVDALWAISLDTLASGDGATIDASTPLLTVFVDATDAAASNG